MVRQELHLALIVAADMNTMAVIQNCAKPYKYRILPISHPRYYCCVSVSFPLYFNAGGIVCTDFYGRKVSTALNSDGSSLKRRYVVVLVKIYS